MAKIDELVDKAKEILVGEVELIEVDNKIKDIFRTEDSLFGHAKDWIINYTDGLKICCSYKVSGDYRIYVTFKIDDFKYDKLMRDVRVKVIDISRH